MATASSLRRETLRRPDVPHGTADALPTEMETTHVGGLGMDEAIDLAGEASFPASDPPAWTPTHAGEPVNHHVGGPELLRDVVSRIKHDAHELHALGARERAALVEQRLAEVGLPIKRRPDESGNVEAVILGTACPVESVVLGARYDASDVSGVATLLAVAHALAGERLARTLRIVALASGEGRVRGEARYLDDLSRSGPQVAAMIAIESLGAGARRVAFVGGWSTRSLTRRATDAFAKAGCGIDGIAWHLPPILSSIRSSVAGPFVERNLPAFMVTDGGAARSGKWRIDDDRIGRTSAALVCVVRELASPL